MKRFLRSEDWLAVWLGFFIIFIVLIGIRPKMPNFKWVMDGDLKKTFNQSTPILEEFIKYAEKNNNTDLYNSAYALKSAVDTKDRVAIQNSIKKFGETLKTVENPDLKKKGNNLNKKLGEKLGAPVNKVFSKENIFKSIYIGIGFLFIATIGIWLMDNKVFPFVIGFPVVYMLSWFSQFIAGNTNINYLGFEYVIFALLIGLFISNVIGVPHWLKEAARTEFYIKTGLVILGSGILFFEIIQAGVIGIIQSILVVSVVWYVCFWLGKKLKVDDDLSAMLATGVSICGVSAAIASCGAIQGDKKKLSYTISLVLIVAVPMMVMEPFIARNFGIPDIIAGAWLGGTLDTTASVVAAGSLISEPAMKVGTIVKFSQNVLIGVAAFILSIWWTLREGKRSGERPGARVIWERFPKFVLGFLMSSFFFSFLIPTDLLKETKGILSSLRTVWFALAFTSIGLETRFIDLFKMGSGRPALAFIGAQIFNIIWTLILAYLMFGGFIFPEPVIK